MHLSSISVYPVKSCRGFEVAESRVAPAGLAGDREWMVLDPAGEVLTARTVTDLYRVTPTPAAGGGLVLDAAGHPPVTVAAPTPDTAATVAVAGMSGMDRALAAGAAADTWLTAVLDRPARLVRLDPAAPRELGARHGGHDGDTFNLSDAGPVLLASEVSRRRVDDWIAERAAEHGEEPTAMVMERFRPNVVVAADGSADPLEPFAEDGWTELRIGDVGFRLGELCDRCVMTTIDPTTLAHGKEPIRTLAAHRRRSGNVWFGVRFIPTGPGRIRVGDPVTAR